MADTPVGPGVRLIKRYANRKLYDTGSGELTSLRRIEELVRDGVDIRVVDHDTGEDMTGEVLVGILGNSVGDRPGEGDIPLLTSLIRAPGDLLAAMFKDNQRTEELRSMGERVRLLSATIDALLGQMEPGAAAGDEAPAPAPKKASAAKKPAAKRPSPARAPTRRR
ncbi:MAG: polyhydroxyalkanoate synthesis regulator DNA-binding domain-containing protein [Acidimicrobiia bacterium]